MYLQLVHFLSSFLHTTANGPIRAWTVFALSVVLNSPSLFWSASFTESAALHLGSTKVQVQQSTCGLVGYDVSLTCVGREQSRHQVLLSLGVLRAAKTF